MNRIIDKDGQPIKSSQELAHDQLFEDLDDIVSKAAKDLDITHILHVCLDYFVGITYKLAPDAENAELIIDKTIQRAKEEYNHEERT